MHRAAVLVLEHDDVNGTVGLLLERDSARRVGDLLKRRDDRRLRPFADEPLRIGGDVLTGERVRLLTRRCDVPGRAGRRRALRVLGRRGVAPRRHRSGEAGGV